MRRGEWLKPLNWHTIGTTAWAAFDTAAVCRGEGRWSVACLCVWGSGALRRPLCAHSREREQLVSCVGTMCDDDESDGELACRGEISPEGGGSRCVYCIVLSRVDETFRVTVGRRC